MTQRMDQQGYEAAARLAKLFDRCPVNGYVHTWSIEYQVCMFCGARWPYADGVSEDGK